MLSKLTGLHFKVFVTIIAVLAIAGCVGQGGVTVDRSELPTAAYSKYDFSFEYPKGMQFLEVGQLEDFANDDSGIVSGKLELTDGTVEIITISWVNGELLESINLEQRVEKALNRMRKAEGVISVVGGDLAETSKDGYRMLYQNYTIEVIGSKANGIYGVWFSDGSQRFYQMDISYSGQEDVLTLYRKYLNSFVE